MFYLVYKITNNVNGRIYIGVHKTTNINDNYMGSGKIIKRAIAKYGKSNFTKEIIKIFDNPEDMFAMESELVNEDFVNDPINYNLVVGGADSLSYVNENINQFKPKEKRQEWAKQGRDKANEAGAHINGKRKFLELMTDEEYRANHCLKISNANTRSFLGKQHSEESKQKIGEKNRVHQTGSKNSNYGKCWIYHPSKKESISVPKNDLQLWVEKGWIKGRKLKW